MCKFVCWYLFDATAHGVLAVLGCGDRCCGARLDAVVYSKVRGLVRVRVSPVPQNLAGFPAKAVECSGDAGHFICKRKRGRFGTPSTRA